MERRREEYKRERRVHQRQLRCHQHQLTSAYLGRRVANPQVPLPPSPPLSLPLPPLPLSPSLPLPPPPSPLCFRLSPCHDCGMCARVLKRRYVLTYARARTRAYALGYRDRAWCCTGGTCCCGCWDVGASVRCTAPWICLICGTLPARSTGCPPSCIHTHTHCTLHSCSLDSHICPGACPARANTKACAGVHVGHDLRRMRVHIRIHHSHL